MVLHVHVVYVEEATLSHCSLPLFLPSPKGLCSIWKIRKQRQRG